MLIATWLPLHEALSGVAGAISLASWAFVLIPQLVENYQSQSAEGISLAFLFIWFIGDICNLLGCLFAGLISTVTALAIYFCVTDAIIIAQCLYYNFKRSRKAAHQDGQGESDNVEQPLLRRRTDSIGLPGSRRRSSASQKRRNSSLLSPSQSYQEVESNSKTWLRNAISIFLVCFAGTLGWVIAWKIGAWQPVSTDSDNGDASQVVGAEVLGYASAVLYLGARIPQIIKNYRERSCNGKDLDISRYVNLVRLMQEGLSLLFFLLSLLGNATYGGGILFHSIEKQYVLVNLPWLIGSLGTMFEDTIIFIQFHMYSPKAVIEPSAVIT